MGERREWRETERGEIGERRGRVKRDGVEEGRDGREWERRDRGERREGKKADLGEREREACEGRQGK